MFLAPEVDASRELNSAVTFGPGEGAYELAIYLHSSADAEGYLLAEGNCGYPFPYGCMHWKIHSLSQISDVSLPRGLEWNTSK